MANFETVAEIFAASSEVLSITETGDTAECRILLHNLESGIKAEDIKSLVEQFQSRDQIFFSITIFGSDAAYFSSKNSDDFENQIESLYAVAESAVQGDLIELKIRVSKTQDAEGGRSIFSLNAFKVWLFSLSLKEKMTWLSKQFIADKDFIRFDCMDGGPPWGTASIHFNGFKRNWTEGASIHEGRRCVLERQNELVNFSDAGTIQLTPFDFSLLADPHDDQLSNLFDDLLGVMTVVATSDYCVFDSEGQRLEARYRGVRVLSRIVGERESVGSRSSCTDVVKWLYSGGELSDKAGLLRNILCLRDEIKFDLSVLHSARSGYELYLKHNITRYIDLKNSVTEFLEGIKGRLEAELESLDKTFGGALIAMVTFFTLHDKN